jgi:hypothetical protein
MGAGDAEVAVGVDFGGEAWVERDRRTVLLDYGWAGQDIAGGQVGAPEDVGWNEAG